MAYGKESTNKQNNLDVNNKLTNLETKTADSQKIKDNATLNSQQTSSSSKQTAYNSKSLNQPSQQDNQQNNKLNKCMSLNEGSNKDSNQQLSTKQHTIAGPTNSNPNDSSTNLNRPLRNCFDAIFTIEKNKSHCILISNDLKLICVYNLKTGTYARKLRNINRPRHIELIDEFRAVVLCDRELNVYNLDECKLIIKLKGFMPAMKMKEMPFYGLHDQNYAVTLSRNRMYVNMINLETGNLETTFKGILNF